MVQKQKGPTAYQTVGPFFLVGTEEEIASERGWGGRQPRALGLFGCGLLGRGLLSGRLLRGCLLSNLFGGRRLLCSSLLGHRYTSFCYDVPGDLYQSGLGPNLMASVARLPTNTNPPFWLCLPMFGHHGRHAYCWTHVALQGSTRQADHPSSPDRVLRKASPFLDRKEVITLRPLT